MRNTDTKPQITQQSVRHVAVQSPARTQETRRCAHLRPWSCNQTSAQTCCCAGADFRNAKLRVRSSLHCTQRKLVWCSPAHLGGFGISAVVSTAQIHVGRPRCSAPGVFLGEVIKRVLHKTSAQLSERLRALLRAASQLFSRKDGGGLQRGNYSDWDLDLIFSNPQSKSPLAKGYFGKVAFSIHQNPSKHLH